MLPSFYYKGVVLLKETFGCNSNFWNKWKEIKINQSRDKLSIIITKAKNKGWLSERYGADCEDCVVVGMPTMPNGNMKSFIGFI